MSGLKYSARMTGEPYLYRETRVVARLILEGMSQSDILKKVKEENLFEYKTGKSVNKSVNAVYSRLIAVNDEVVKQIAISEDEKSRVLVVYILMKTNRLFCEFIKEVLNEKIKLKYQTIEKEDVMFFLKKKAEESEVVAKWYDSTFNKLRQVFIKTLTQAGLLDGTRSRKIVPYLYDGELNDLFDSLGEGKYYSIILGE